MSGRFWNIVGGRAELGSSAEGLQNLYANQLNGGGQWGGHRNRWINGGSRIMQRANGGIALAVNTPGYGGADRMLTAYTATTGSAVLTTAVVGYPSATGYAHQLANLTTTGTTAVSTGTFLESADVYDLSTSVVAANRRVSLGCWMYHTFGSTLLWYPEIYKPTALDNFSGLTAIAALGGTAVPVGVPDSTWTFVGATYQLAQGDSFNGLYARFLMPGMTAVTNKNAWFCNLQLEPGSSLTPFEARHQALERLLCQRYYYEIYPQASGLPICQGSLYTSSELYCVLNYPTRMRIVPAIGFSAVSDWNIFSNATSAVATNVSAGTISDVCAELYFQKAGVFTSGHSGWVRAASTGARITFNSELT